MTWQTTTDVTEFSAFARDFLTTRPVENTLVLSIVDTLGRRGDGAFGAAAPRFGWWRAADGSIGAAFLQTPPYPVLVASPCAEAGVADLMRLLTETNPVRLELNGDNETVAHAARWRYQLTGDAGQPGRHTRLYRLGRLTLPDPLPPGQARTAGSADQELLMAWYEAFGRDVGETISNAATLIEDRLRYGGLTLWECDGVPVAMAGVTHPIAGVARVAPVYTPTDLRGHGYAGAATAAASRAALEAGATDVVLFTDLANPTSNGLYQRLGYRPVHDRVIISFGSPAPEGPAHP